MKGKGTLDAVILFSHGSLLCGFGDALADHAARLRSRCISPLVEIGYLNYSDPPFAAAVERCAEAGAVRIAIVPYFLVPGYFVNVGLPKCVAEARAAHPGIEFFTAQPIGFDDRLADALIIAAERSAGPERWRDELIRATRCCRNDRRCPVFDSPHCHYGAIAIEPSPASPEPEGAREFSPNTALLVMVHGSPQYSANSDMLHVLERIRARGIFSAVQEGFLECNEPSIAEAIDRCVAGGAETVIAVPYFLHTGKHVANDLPTLLETARERYRKVNFRLGPYVGRLAEVTDILADRAATTRSFQVN